MAKKKKSKSGNKPKFQRSDIPFVQRMAMQRQYDIVMNRDHAAKITMYCASVAMHELEGIGYKRLVRFSLYFKDVVDEFYEDPDVGMAHAKNRLDQMGMEISGELYAVKIDGVSKRELEINNHRLQAAQIALICAAVAMNDVFGFGKERQSRIDKRINELSGRYAREGEKFLLEEMEKIGFSVVDGDVMAYTDDDGNFITPKQWREQQ